MRYDPSVHVRRSSPNNRSRRTIPGITRACATIGALGGLRSGLQFDPLDPIMHRKRHLLRF